MFKRNSLRKYFTLILMFFTVVIGFSSWIIVGEKNVNLGIAPVTKTVCYINNDAEGYRYTRIEKALEVAVSGDIVYVVPGSETTIYKDCTIKSGVTLCLPHNGTVYHDSTISEMQDLDGDGEEDDNEFTFIDSTLEKIEKNRVTFVTMSENVELTIKSGGKLLIGGQFGREGQTMSGQTTGLYCELGMKKNSKIISNGTIECYGYIKELDNLNNGSFIELKAGILKCPLVIYDYKGGSITSDMSSANICPFDIFDLPNIQSLMRIYSGVVVNTELRMVVTLAGLISQNINLIGNTTSNTMMSLTSGYVEWKYTPDILGITSDAVGSRTKINVFGDFSFGSIQISVGIGAMGLNIDTDKYFLPLSYKFQITIESGYNLTVDKKVKMMPGCTVITKENSNVIFNNSVILYQAGYTETSSEYAMYPTGLPKARLIINGIATITSTGCVGGLIENSLDNAILGINSSTYSVTSAEFSTDDVTMSMQLYVDNKDNLVTISSNKTYISKKECWIIFDREFKLSYIQVLTDKVGNIVKDPVGIDNPTDPATLAINSSEELDIYDNVDFDSQTYRFIGWYYDEACKEKISNNTIYGTQLVSRADSNYNVNLYAKWSLADPITVKYFDYKGNQSGALETYISGEQINLRTALESSVISEDVKNNYEFLNWKIILGEGDNLQEFTVNPLDNFTIPIDYSYTKIDIKPVFNQLDSQYKLVNTSTGGLQSVTIDGVAISFSSVNNENIYWVEEGKEISVKIGGIFTNANLTITKRDDSNTEILTGESGGWYASKTYNFNMPDCGVNIYCQK